MTLRTKISAYFLSLLHNTSHHWWDAPVRAILSWASWLYGWGVTAVYRSYADCPDRQVRLTAAVISLGNITVGGTGKTPAACLVAKYLQSRGIAVALLNRGYRAKKEKETAVMSDGEHILLSAAEGGDEACLLARTLPGIPVLIGRDRSRSGQLAVDLFHARVLVLDDGFQHWRLRRDLDIVLIDGTNPFGNGKLLPRGMLREPMAQLCRAGLFILTKTDQVSRPDIEAIYTVLRRYNPQAPIAESIHQARWCISFADWNSLKPRETCRLLPKGTRVVAVSALGNPGSFEETLRTAGYEVVQAMRYDDHHQYSQEDALAMKRQADAAEAVLVTTEKDAVKLDPAAAVRYRLPLYVLGIELVIVKGEETVYTALQNIVQEVRL